MRVLIDSREQRPYTFFTWPEVSVEVVALPVGDYSLAGLSDRVALERKSLDDLAQTLTAGRERFAAECQRGRGLDLFGLVIEGTVDDVLRGRYQSRANPKSIAQTLIAWSIRFDFTVWFAGNRQNGELMVYSILSKYLREAQTRHKAILDAHYRPEAGHGPIKAV